MWQSSFFELIALMLLVLVFPLKRKMEFERNAFLFLSASWSVIFFVFLHRLVFGDRFYFAETGIWAFGNHNMAAEYAVLLLGLFMSTRMRFIRRLKAGNKVATSILASLAFFIPFTFSRSAILGLISIAVISFPLHWKRRRQLPIAIALAAAIGFGLASYMASTGTIIAAKASSGAERLNLYKATLKLIRENPMGIGIGQFEFGAAPWLQQFGLLRSAEVFKSPHSEPLRLVAENGWIFGILLAALVFFFVRGFRFRKLRIGLPFFGAFLFQAAFQFPLEVPGSVLLIAFATWKFVSPNVTSISQPVFTRTCRWLVGATAMATFAFGVAHALSVMAPVNIPLSRWIPTACDLDPYNWRVCGEAMRFEGSTGRIDIVRRLAQRQLRIRPWNFSILLNWASIEAQFGNSEISCEIAQQVIGLIPAERSRFEYCGFTYVDPKTIMKHYPNWIRSTTNRATSL